MNKVYLALYKGRKKGGSIKVWSARFADWLICTITRSPYSHCEIAIIDESYQYPPHIYYEDDTPAPTIYTCYSASARDGGVRVKYMPLPPEKWDLIQLPHSVEISSIRLFKRTIGQRYDWPGVIGAVLKSPHCKRRWFCSEWCAQALCYLNPHNYTPASLARAVKGEKHEPTHTATP